MKKKRITIETPCTVTELENLLHVVSHEGHWHDAAVRTNETSVVIEYEDDMEKKE